MLGGREEWGGKKQVPVGDFMMGNVSLKMRDIKMIARLWAPGNE